MKAVPNPMQVIRTKPRPAISLPVLEQLQKQLQRASSSLAVAVRSAQAGLGELEDSIQKLDGDQQGSARQLLKAANAAGEADVLREAAQKLSQVHARVAMKIIEAQRIELQQRRQK